jgi:hypothetical protein
VNWQHLSFPAQEPDGTVVGVVVAKGTFTVGEDRVPRPAEDPEPVRLADALFEGEDPSVSPVRLESDLVARKDRTDVVVKAVAHAPGGRPAASFDAEVVVGRHRKRIRVMGPRQALYRGPARPSLKDPVKALPLFTEPAPVARVPVTPFLAYGGVARFRVPGTEDVLDLPCPANPFGRGYCVQNSPEGLEGLALPQIEDPENLLTPETLVRDLATPESVPWPAVLTPFGRAWYPRSSYAGVPPHDVPRVRDLVRAQADGLDPEKDADAIAMLREYEPPVLAPEFHQCAAPGLAVPLLAGDESVTLRNLSPDGTLSFNLPGRAPLVRVGTGDDARTVPMDLDTVAFDAETGRLELTFRGRLPLPTPEAVDAFPGAPVALEDVDLARARREGIPP